MIEKFFNIHKQEDIYVLGAGKSLDFIDQNFFKNKISIGVNRIGIKINTNYLIIKDKKSLDEIINNTKENQVVFVSKGNFGEDNNANKDYILNNYKNKKNIIIFNHEKNKHRVTSIPNSKNYLVVSHSTITSAIHLAAFMGAANIILIGHDCGYLNGEIYCSGYYEKEEHRKICWKNFNNYEEWLRLIENDTINLKRLLSEKYNCNIYSLNPFINFGLENNNYKKIKYKKFT